jgi:hypothetical protein
MSAMNIDFSLINWAAVGVAGAAAFILGGLWYSALFGKLWIRMQGWSDEKVAQMKATMSPGLFLLGMLVSYLIVALAGAVLVVTLDWRGAASGAKLGLILWLAVGAITFTGHLASGRRLGAFLLDAAFQFVALVTQGVILAAWR